MMKETLPLRVADDSLFWRLWEQDHGLTHGTQSEFCGLWRKSNIRPTQPINGLLSVPYTEYEAIPYTLCPRALTISRSQVLASLEQDLNYNRMRVSPNFPMDYYVTLRITRIEHDLQELEQKLEPYLDEPRQYFCCVNDGGQQGPVGYCANHCQGHSTPGEACDHYIQYLQESLALGQYLSFTGKEGQCAVCKKDTRGYARIDVPYTFWEDFLCDTHRTFAVVKKRLAYAVSPDGLFIGIQPLARYQKKGRSDDDENKKTEA